MKRLVTAAALFLILVGDASANDATAAMRGLEAAVRNGHLPRAHAARYRAIVFRASPAAANALAVVAAHAARYDEPRALTLFSMLDANARHLAVHRAGVARDIVGADGIVYRYFGGYGYQFHPLASFARLNRAVSLGDRSTARRLGSALVARAVPHAGALAWEYYFPFGGPAPWRSGFVQAVAAQALARAAVLTDEQELGRAARAALAAIGKGLSRPLAGGVWVREYGFSDMAVLNAQLQSLVSLHYYVETTGDPRGRALVIRLERASLALLRAFDMGSWSRYSLGGAAASLHYHEYHVQLLRQLAAVRGAPLWRTMHARWSRFLGRRR